VVNRLLLLTPISRELGAVKELVEKGKVRWKGEKPMGLPGIKTKGKPVSKTIIIEEQR